MSDHELTEGIACVYDPDARTDDSIGGHLNSHSEGDDAPRAADAVSEPAVPLRGSSDAIVAAYHRFMDQRRLEAAESVEIISAAQDPAHLEEPWWIEVDGQLPQDPDSRYRRNEIISQQFC